MKERLMKMRVTKKVFGLVLALAMVVALLPVNSLKVKAQTIPTDNCHNYGYNGNCNTCNFGFDYIGSYNGGSGCRWYCSEHMGEVWKLHTGLASCTYCDWVCDHDGANSGRCPNCGTDLGAGTPPATPPSPAPTGGFGIPALPADLFAPTTTPAPANNTVAAPVEVKYTVVAGDTLNKIAARNGITLERILELNPEITNPNLIRVGQVIKLEVTSEASSNDGNASAATASDYTVVSGDTMSKIARRNNISLAELTSKNPQITDINKIKVGQKINL